jgi:hypothetical protein
MKAAPFVALGFALLALAGCVGIGPSGGRRTGCYDDRYSAAPSVDAPPPTFFFFCHQSP